MDSRRTAALFFGLGFLVLATGIYMTTRNRTNNPNGGSAVKPQIVNRGINNFIPNAVNESAGNSNKFFNNEKCQKIKTDLCNVPGVTNVDAVVAGNSALVTCSVADNLKQQSNFRDTLAAKVKEIDPSLTTVYVMENTDNINQSFSQITNHMKNGNTTSAKQSWDNIWQQITSNVR